VIAILRYAFLKSRRDGSLAAFLIMPIFMPMAALCGATMAKGLRYPLFMNVEYTPVQNATLVADVATVVFIVFSALPAFWTLRSEIASRAIGSFLFGVRPLTAVLALILFAAAVGVTGWLGAVLMIGALTSAFPPDLPMRALQVVLSCLAGSASGALVVTISSQPAMIVCSYLGCLLFIPWMSKAPMASFAITALVLSAVWISIAAFLLERRCAT
jgi:hypothetical protein